jgi:hypothetical protein
MFLNFLKAVSNLFVFIVMTVTALFSIGFLMMGIVTAYVTLVTFINLTKLSSLLKRFIDENSRQSGGGRSLPEKENTAN